jgi:hypothetical protein
MMVGAVAEEVVEAERSALEEGILEMYISS